MGAPFVGKCRCRRCLYLYLSTSEGACPVASSSSNNGGSRRLMSTRSLVQQQQQLLIISNLYHFYCQKILLFQNCFFHTQHYLLHTLPMPQVCTSVGLCPVASSSSSGGGNRRLMNTFTSAAHSVVDTLLAGSSNSAQATWGKAAEAVRARCVT